MTYDGKMSEQPQKMCGRKEFLWGQGGEEVKSQITACLRKYCEEDSGTGKAPEFCYLQGPIFKSHQCWTRTSQLRAHRFWEIQVIPRQALKNNATI